MKSEGIGIEWQGIPWGLLVDSIGGMDLQELQTKRHRCHPFQRVLLPEGILPDVLQLVLASTRGVDQQGGGEEIPNVEDGEDDYPHPNRAIQEFSKKCI